MALRVANEVIRVYILDRSFVDIAWRDNAKADLCAENVGRGRIDLVVICRHAIRLRTEKKIRICAAVGRPEV